MNKQPYVIFRELVKYYIVPSTSYPMITLPQPNSYISFYFKRNAEAVLKSMNAAFREGCRVNSFFKDK